MKHTKTTKYGSITEQTETVPEEAKALDLLDKYFESSILKMLKELKETVDKELNETRRMTAPKIETVSKDMEITKRNKFWRCKVK